MPALFRTRSAITLYIARLFILCEIAFVIFSSVKADRDHIKIFTGIQIDAL